MEVSIGWDGAHSMPGQMARPRTRYKTPQKQTARAGRQRAVCVRAAAGPLDARPGSGFDQNL
ncbi:hypothetical protein [Burkholderia gladioli]|uniref:hypothetical protein n=1 Tax=Burkholderia gladioli TaxID=28095 RepID=UPI00163F12C7|nr:hypothetical protein [Burkholderia gladioli]MBU9179718.1 hypothetical protein [Burkholderia gladioli]MDN7753450.1 hypothetical protein [Burkholderia gladioli]